MASAMAKVGAIGLRTGGKVAARAAGKQVAKKVGQKVGQKVGKSKAKNVSKKIGEQVGKKSKTVTKKALKKNSEDQNSSRSDSEFSSRSSSHSSKKRHKSKHSNKRNKGISGERKSSGSIDSRSTKPKGHNKRSHSRRQSSSQTSYSTNSDSKKHNNTIFKSKSENSQSSSTSIRSNKMFCKPIRKVKHNDSFSGSSSTDKNSKVKSRFGFCKKSTPVKNSANTYTHKKPMLKPNVLVPIPIKATSSYSENYSDKLNPHSESSTQKTSLSSNDTINSTNNTLEYDNINKPSNVYLSQTTDSNSQDNKYNIPVKKSTNFKTYTNSNKLSQPNNLTVGNLKLDDQFKQSYLMNNKTLKVPVTPSRTTDVPTIPISAKTVNKPTTSELNSNLTNQIQSTYQNLLNQEASKEINDTEFNLMLLRLVKNMLMDNERNEKQEKSHNSKKSEWIQALELILNSNDCICPGLKQLKKCNQLKSKLNTYCDALNELKQNKNSATNSKIQSLNFNTQDKDDLKNHKQTTKIQKADSEISDKIGGDDNNKEDNNDDIEIDFVRKDAKKENQKSLENQKCIEEISNLLSDNQCRSDSSSSTNSSELRKRYQAACRLGDIIRLLNGCEPSVYNEKLIELKNQQKLSKLNQTYSDQNNRFEKNLFCPQSYEEQRNHYYRPKSTSCCSPQSNSMLSNNLTTHPCSCQNIFKPPDLTTPVISTIPNAYCTLPVNFNLSTQLQTVPTSPIVFTDNLEPNYFILPELYYGPS